MVVVDGMVMIGPPNDIVRTDRVMLAEASALAMNEILELSEPSSRLVPLKVAFWTDCDTCCRIDWKSWFKALREVVSMDVSMAPTTFWRIWFSRSEMFAPAAEATEAIESARLRLSVTACSELRSERWLWAMEYTDALSLALLTARPVEITFWTLSSSEFVVDRF